MGTPAFAAPSLEALVHGAHEVLAVFCQPDRPRGRSRKPALCPVKESALERNIPVYQPKRIRAKKWVRILHELAPDLVVVAAFGQILPRSVLDIPALGCINVHASLLPRWRGASPIHFALLAGDPETGVAIMKMEEGLDTGPVYSLERVSMEPGMGRLELERILAKSGARLLLETLPTLGKREPRPQEQARATYAPMIRKEMGYCRFQEQSAAHIARMVAAFEGWPGVLCLFRGKPLKLLKVAPTGQRVSDPPGAIVSVTKKSLTLTCAQGTELAILEVQPSGKKPVPIAAFINGYQPKPGERFGELPSPSETD